MTLTVDVCNQPPALSEDDLSAALTGVADETILGHLSACAHCARRLYDMQVFEGALTARLFRRRCPNADMLSEFVLGRLEAGVYAHVANHLTTCNRCDEEVNWLRVAQHDLLTTPAPMVVSDPVTKPGPMDAQDDLPHLVERLRRIVGKLLPAQPQLVLRGTANERTWSAAFDGGQVFIELQPEQNHFRLTGQLVIETGLLANPWMDALIQVRQVDNLAATAFLDELGEFACDLDTDAPITLMITSLSGIQLHLHGSTTDDTDVGG